jgi:hypothetical protein
MNFLPSLAKYQVSKSQQKGGREGGGSAVYEMGELKKHLLLKNAAR